MANWHVRNSMEEVGEAEKVIYRCFSTFEYFLRQGSTGVGVISKASRVQIRQKNSHFWAIMIL